MHWKFKEIWTSTIKKKKKLPLKKISYTSVQDIYYKTLTEGTKSTSPYPKNSGKCVTTAPPADRFSPKVDWHQFMLGLF